MGFFDSVWDSALNKAAGMLSHSLGPVPLDFAPTPKEEELPQSYYDNIHVPLPPYSHFSEQEKFDIFEKWIIKKKKVYCSKREKLHRFEMVKDTMKEIEDVCSGLKTPCPLGLTETADLSDHEYRKKMGGPLLSPEDYKDYKKSGPQPKFWF